MATATITAYAPTGNGTATPYYNKIVMLYNTTTGLVSDLAVTNNSPRASVLNIGTLAVTIPAGAVSESIAITGALSTVDVLTALTTAGQGVGMGGP